MVPFSFYPLLVIVLMVKNEADTIIPTLQPFLDGGVRHFLVYDTGSTDNTPEIARGFFEKHASCNAQVVQEEFIDFSQSRNLALDIAEELFPDSVFMLMPDAEWYIHNVPELLAFCQKHAHDSEPSYLMRLHSAGNDFYVPRLLRVAAHCRFSGAVHEVINKVSHEKLPEDVFCIWQATQESQEKSQVRYVRDRILLLREHAQKPQDPRTVFYLAQACWGAGFLHEARDWYIVRTGMSGWDEEDYLTLYRLGLLTQELGKIDCSATWEQAQKYYLQAYAMRPRRAEPLVRIAEHYYHAGMLPLCALFADRACQIPFPSDIGFVEKYMYDTLRYDLYKASIKYAA